MHFIILGGRVRIEKATTNHSASAARGTETKPGDSFTEGSTGEGADTGSDAGQSEDKC